jgi:hypothetical protein
LFETVDYHQLNADGSTTQLFFANSFQIQDFAINNSGDICYVANDPINCRAPGGAETTLVPMQEGEAMAFT